MAEDANATNLVRITAADKEQAKAIGKARKSESERESGGGSVEMDLTVEAQAEAPFTLVGARPGVDGTYRIVSVRHSASRSGGATTSLELKQPQDGAGKDTRGKSGSGSTAVTPSAGGSGALPSGPGGFLPGI